MPKHQQGKQSNKVYHTQQNLLSNLVIDNNSSLFNVLKFLCSEANKLSKCAIYLARQLWFKVHKFIGKFDLEKKLKTNPHYSTLYSQVAQQNCQMVAESFKSFYELDKMFRKGKLEDKPRPPKYLKKGGLAILSYPSQNLELVNGEIRLPLGKTVTRWFELQYLYIPLPTNLKFQDIKEIRIVPRNRCFYVEFVRHVELPKNFVELDKTQALGIDPGVTNLLTCVSTRGQSFIVDGRKIKSLNQWYNKEVSRLKTGKTQGLWSNKLAAFTEKRNRQMRDGINKVARIVVNYCLDNKLGTLVFGWNKGNKQSSNLGDKNNQNFFQIPLARLKARVQQLCQEYGIQFIETEESYSSSSSFLDNEVLPTYGEKSNEEKVKFSGKRVFRGLFRTVENFLINADCNAAANILRKVARRFRINLNQLSRGALTTPLRVLIWTA